MENKAREGFAAETSDVRRITEADEGDDGEESSVPAGDEPPVHAFSTWESLDGWLPPGRPIFSSSPKRCSPHASYSEPPWIKGQSRKSLLGSVLSESGTGSIGHKSVDEELHERVQTLKKKAVVDAWVKKTKHEPLLDRYIRRFLSLGKGHGDRKETSTSSWKGGLSTFRLRKHKSTSDGRQVTLPIMLPIFDNGVMWHCHSRVTDP